MPDADPPGPGISRPLYCCTSVGACYGEACRVNGYSAYAASGIPPGAGRTGCSLCTNDQRTKCNHGLKTGKLTRVVYIELNSY